MLIYIYSLPLFLHTSTIALAWNYKRKDCALLSVTKNFLFQRELGVSARQCAGGVGGSAWPPSCPETLTEEEPIFVEEAGKKSSSA